jgi:hypothetical protein
LTFGTAVRVFQILRDWLKRCAQIVTMLRHSKLHG